MDKQNSLTDLRGQKEGGTGKEKKKYLFQDMRIEHHFCNSLLVPFKYSVNQASLYSFFLFMHVRIQAMTTTLCSKTLKRASISSLMFSPTFAPPFPRAAVMNSRGYNQGVNLYAANFSAASTELISASSWASFLLLASRMLSAPSLPPVPLGPPASIAGSYPHPNSECWGSYSSLILPNPLCNKDPQTPLLNFRCVHPHCSPEKYFLSSLWFQENNIS